MPETSLQRANALLELVTAQRNAMFDNMTALQVDQIILRKENQELTAALEQLAARGPGKVVKMIDPDGVEIPLNG